MGSLSVSIAALSSEVTFNDAKGATIINDFIDLSLDGPEGAPEMTNQERLDWFVQALADHIVSMHRRKVRNEAIAAAVEETWE